jgi:hypothetical protein
MAAGRWLGRLLAVGLLLVTAVFTAGPAAAAPCALVTCYQYVPDISVTGWTYPSALPVIPGSIHQYTGVVTNTGWRLGGRTGPIPWPQGPTSGVVYLGFIPGTADDVPQSCQVDIGPHLSCFAGYHGRSFDLGSMPTNTTYQFTVSFQAPQTVGTYTFRIFAYDFPDPQPWTDYNQDNNSITLTYQVGYWA